MAAPAPPDVAQLALEFVSTRVLDISAGGAQALCLSDLTRLDRLALGSVNRNVNLGWARELVQTMFTQLHTTQERTTLTVCIDVTQLQAALEDPEARERFQASILDGQHRFTALQLIKAERPDVVFQFWLVVHIVRSDAEQQQLITRLDRRLQITDADHQIIEARKLFKDALVLITGPEHTRKHAFLEAANHAVLRDPRVSSELARVRDVARFRELLARCALDYKPLWNACAKSRLTSGQQALIKASEAYFYVTSPAEWVPHALLGAPVGPLREGLAKKVRQGKVKLEAPAPALSG